MNVIVTGASGFIGRNFISQSTDLQIRKVNLRTTTVDQIDFKNIDCVLHLAALVHHMKDAPEEKEYFKINCDLPFNIAKRAKERGVSHFIFMSTAKVYGEITPLHSSWNENVDCCPQDPYSKSKYEAEKLIQSLQCENFRIAIIRPPLVYGAGVKANMLNLIRLVDNFSFLPLGKINNKRSLVYIGNLVALINTIIENRASGIFIAGDNTILSTSELTKLIAEKLGKKLFLFKVPHLVIRALRLYKPGIVNRVFDSFNLDNSLSNKKLNFNPPFQVDHGINEMVQWYKEIKHNKK